MTTELRYKSMYEQFVYAEESLSRTTFIGHICAPLPGSAGCVYMRLQGQEYWPQWPRHTVTTLGRVIIIITTHLLYTAPPHTRHVGDVR